MSLRQQAKKTRAFSSSLNTDFRKPGAKQNQLMAGISNRAQIGILCARVNQADTFRQQGCTAGLQITKQGGNLALNTVGGLHRSDRFG